MANLLKSGLLLNSRNPMFKKAKHAPKKPEKPATASAAQASASKDPRIDILILRRRDPGHEGELYAKVRLWSHVMTNRIMEGIVEFIGKSEREIAEAVAAVAGASAERFGEQYGDLIDPSQAAKVALSQLRRLFDEWERK